MKPSKFLDKIVDLTEKQLQKKGISDDYIIDWDVDDNKNPILKITYPNTITKVYNLENFRKRQNEEDISVKEIFKDEIKNIIFDDIEHYLNPQHNITETMLNATDTPIVNNVIANAIIAVPDTPYTYKDFLQDVKNFCAEKEDIKLLKIAMNGVIKDTLYMEKGESKLFIDLKNFFGAKTAYEGRFIYEIEDIYEDREKLGDNSNGLILSPYIYNDKFVFSRVCSSIYMDYVTEAIREDIVNDIINHNSDITQAPVLCNDSTLGLDTYFYIQSQHTMIDGTINSTEPIVITNDMLCDWNISIQDLKNIAKSNMEQRGNTVINESEIGTGETLKMYIVTNANNDSGAIEISTPGTIARLRDLIKEDFYIIPSSFHEVYCHSTKNIEGNEMDYHEFERDSICQFAESIGADIESFLPKYETISGDVFRYDYEDDRIINLSKEEREQENRVNDEEDYECQF